MTSDSVTPFQEVFAGLINEVCSDLNISVDWRSDFWIALLRKGEKEGQICGACFSLNNAASARIADDKVATTAVLHSNSVDAAPHRLLRFSSYRYNGPAVENAMNGLPFPLVIKPTTGSCGLDVRLAKSRQEVLDITRELSGRHTALALSPFFEIASEHQAIVLDGNTLMAFRKETQHDLSGARSEWRRNIRLGADSVLERDPLILDRLEGVASKAMKAIGARFMSVDIINASTDCKVLEMNSGVYLDRTASISFEHRTRSLSVYEAALRSMLF